MKEEDEKNSEELVGKYNLLSSSLFLEPNPEYKRKDSTKQKPQNKLKNNLDEIFIKAMKQINIDSVLYEPKLIPFLPGLEANISNINII